MGTREAPPLRVLMVTPRYLPSVGGTEIHTWQTARHLSASGAEVTVLAADALGRTERSTTDSVRLVRVPAQPRGGDLFFSPAVYREVADGSWDVVHLQGYHTLVPPTAILAARRARIPYVLTFHSGGHSSHLREAVRGVQAAALRPLLAGAHRLICMSRFEAWLFSRRLRLPYERFAVIPSGSQLEPASKRLPHSGADPLIVSVGRLERYKGHQHVIAALPLVSEREPKVRLRLVGSGPYEADLRRLAHTLGIAHRVQIAPLPASDRDAMAALLAEAALVVSLSEYESLGMGVLEAIGLGCSVLVANTTALNEFAERGLARSIERGNPEDTARAIVEQLRAPFTPTALELPTWAGCAASLLEVYRAALGSTMATT